MQVKEVTTGIGIRCNLVQCLLNLDLTPVSSILPSKDMTTYSILNLSEGYSCIATVIQPDQLYILCASLFLAECPQLLLPHDEEELALDDCKPTRGPARRAHHLDHFVCWEGVTACGVDDEAESTWPGLDALPRQNLEEGFGVSRELENNAGEARSCVLVHTEANADQWAFLDSVGDLVERHVQREVEEEDETHLLGNGLAWSTTAA
jgi:hypothetical protein